MSFSDQNNLNSDADKHETMICPALGSLNDSETRFAYPSTGNFCHRVKPAEAVALEYQKVCCLAGKYHECQVFSGAMPNGLPDHISGNHSAGPKPIFRRAWFVLLIFVLVAGGIFGAYLIFGDKFLQSNAALVSLDTPTQELLATQTPSNTAAPAESEVPPSTLTPTLTHTPSPTLTATVTPQPSPTNTLPPTPGPSLGTPFGTENIYVLHRVLDGQGFNLLSNLYNTTEDVIRAANILRAGRSIWPGDILIIPVNQQDPDQVVQFQYLFVEKKTLLSDLSDQYGVSENEIRSYNLLGVDEWVPAGRWLIIPVIDG